jgi:hypothetical protein
MDVEDYKGTCSLHSTVYTNRTLRNELLGADFNTLFYGKISRGKYTVISRPNESRWHRNVRRSGNVGSEIYNIKSKRKVHREHFIWENSSNVCKATMIKRRFFKSKRIRIII